MTLKYDTIPKDTKSDGIWTSQINSEHGSKDLFMQQVSKCIFTNCPDDLINFNKAWETAGFNSNGAKEKRGVTARHTYLVSFLN